MAIYLAADMRLFEDVHRLNQQRLIDTQLANQALDLRRPRKLTEGGIEIVESVANLVNGLLLALSQPSIVEKSILFKKEPNLVSRFQEVFVAGARLFVGRKDRN